MYHIFISDDKVSGIKPKLQKYPILKTTKCSLFHTGHQRMLSQHVQMQRSFLAKILIAQIAPIVRRHLMLRHQVAAKVLNALHTLAADGASVRKLTAVHGGLVPAQGVHHVITGEALSALIAFNIRSQWSRSHRAVSMLGVQQLQRL